MENDALRLLGPILQQADDPGRKEEIGISIMIAAQHCDEDIISGALVTHGNGGGSTVVVRRPDTIRPGSGHKRGAPFQPIAASSDRSDVRVFHRHVCAVRAEREVIILVRPEPREIPLRDLVDHVRMRVAMRPDVAAHRHRDRMG